MTVLKSNSSLSGNSGFTLIELVAVIVVIGVLAATALPKFINFSSGARLSTLKAMRGSLESAVGNLRGACIVYEECRNLPSWPNLYVFLPAYGQRFMLIGGYPEAGTLSREGEIHDLISSSGFEVTNPNSKLTRWSIPSVDSCYVQYKQIDGGETFPLIELVSSGC
ncbi:MAG TPA: type II secretion system protein [Porticoccus sp.]|nr:type II secretion system protein [Porticoccus sp.]